MILGSLVKAGYNRTQLRLISLLITGTMQTQEIGWRKQMLEKGLGPRFHELGMERDSKSSKIPFTCWNSNAIH
jgi:hypothetical protein